MRLLDERYRLFGVVNPVDLLAIAFLVVVAFVASNLLFGKAQPQAVKKDAVPITYSLQIESLRTEYADPELLTKGDLVSKKGGKPIGKLTNWSVADSPREIGTAEGKYAKVPSPMFVDLILDVEAEAEKTANGWLVSDIQIRNNGTIEIQTPTFEGMAKVKSLKVEEAE